MQRNIPHWGCSCNRSEEHTSELQSQSNLVCRLLLEKKKKEKESSILRPQPVWPRHHAQQWRLCGLFSTLRWLGSTANCCRSFLFFFFFFFKNAPPPPSPPPPPPPPPPAP